MGHIEFFRQARQAARVLQRVQVLALDILYQRDAHRGAIIQFSHYCGNFMQARQLRRAPAPFPGDDLKLSGIGQGPDQDRLQHPLRLDGIRQFLQRILVKIQARLVGATLQ